MNQRIMKLVKLPYIMPCEACEIKRAKTGKGRVNIATEYHHKFSKTKPNLKLYGVKLIDNKKNLMPACNECNASHASECLIHWNEIDFCKAMKLKPRSKEGLAIWNRLQKNERWEINENSD